MAKKPPVIVTVAAASLPMETCNGDRIRLLVGTEIRGIEWNFDVWIFEAAIGPQKKWTWCTSTEQPQTREQSS
jgi:hypothetical protein